MRDLVGAFVLGLIVASFTIALGTVGLPTISGAMGLVLGAAFILIGCLGEVESFGKYGSGYLLGWFFGAYVMWQTPSIQSSAILQIVEEIGSLLIFIVIKVVQTR